MYTLCPRCKAVFRITAEQLAAKQGRVRCGQCRAAFDALEHLADDANRLTVSQPVVAAPPPPLAISPAATPLIAAREGEEVFDIVHAPPVAAAERVLAAGEKRGWAGTLAWAALNLSLILLLAGQYVYFYRDDLARYPELRPALETMCEVMGCEIPLRRDVSRLSLVNRDLRSHPSAANALLVRAALINNAPFPQPYPVLQLSLSNVAGQTVAMRRFQSFEYLGKDIPIKKGMLPGKPVEVTLELVDPGQNAVSFEFAFF
ncbi:MAG: zinc-ribbon domain-containing protein [Gammaproteobacteria bacterium]|nr:zinc-ribbon domain-containing protein [Gammaproteobacteria bacterium]